MTVVLKRASKLVAPNQEGCEKLFTMKERLYKWAALLPRPQVVSLSTVPAKLKADVNNYLGP